jgi:hypothetical protein
MGAVRVIGRAVLALGSGTLVALLAARRAEERRLAQIWEILESEPGPGRAFSAEMVADLPDAARRYFLHAIRPGTPLASRLHWRYSGTLKPAPQLPWMPIRAEQIVTKERGFAWKAVARKGPLLITVADHYLEWDARMRVNLFGLIPVVNASDPDLARSALGRLLVESVALPTSILPGPNIRIEGLDASRFRAIVSLHGETTPITVTVDDEGRVQDMSMPRWGNLTDDGSFRYIPYGAIAEEERTFGGYTIPSRLRVGWWYGTDRYLEVVRLRLDEARLY